MDIQSERDSSRLNDSRTPEDTETDSIW